MPQFQSLHKWLEVEYNPLTLCSNVQSVIEFIQADEKIALNQYIEALQDVTLVRLVRQVSQVYQTIEFERFVELAKFASSFKLERILVDCVRHNDMQITIDHKLKMVMFGTDLSESQREDHHDGPTLQSMPSEQVRQQLVNMSVVLHRAIAAINPNRKKGDRESLRAQMVALYHENKVREHQSILIRQKLIEDRKERIEKLNTEREEEELRRQEELKRQKGVAEEKRLKQEAEEREKKRQENELKQIKNRTMIEKIQQISQTTHGQKILKIIEEKGTTADPEEIAREEQNALLRERKELQARLKSQEKKIDYFERAKRIEEVPLIKDYLKEMVVKEEVFWQTQEETRIENAIAERKNAVAQQERLKRIYGDRDEYMNKLKAERKNVFLDKLDQFNKTFEEERKKRLAQRVIERRKERRDSWLAEREAEKKRKLEEIRLEEEEIKRQQQEARKKERELEMEKLNIQSEKQRQREEEVEKKMLEQREKRSQDNGGRDSEQSAWGPKKARDAGPPKEEGPWRTNRVEPEADAGAKWRRGGEEKDDQGGAFRKNDREKYGRDNRDRDTRVESDADAGAKWRRGGEEKSDSRGPMRRGGDESGPIRRGGDDSGPIRRGGDDSAPIRRSGDESAPIRRSGDDRDSQFRRGGEDRSFNSGRRDDRGGNRGREERGPMRRNEGGPMRREGGGREEGGNTNWRARGSGEAPKDDGGSWRRDTPRDDKEKN